jgi:hypothetical protein
VDEGEQFGQLLDLLHLLDLPQKGFDELMGCLGFAQVLDQLFFGVVLQLLAASQACLGDQLGN